MLTRGEIAEHYNRPEIKYVVIRLASSGNLSRAGCGDRVGWYWPNRKEKRTQKYNLADSNEYDRIVSKHYRVIYSCLLYTSDAADEEDSVDLGGRRIIK